MTFFGYVLISMKDLNGLHRRCAKFERKARRGSEWTGYLQAKLYKLRGQIRGDQAYIDALEAELPGYTIEVIRKRMKSLRTTAALKQPSPSLGLSVSPGKDTPDG